MQITGPDATVTDNVIEGNYNAIIVVGNGLDALTGAHGRLSPVRTTVTNNAIIASGHAGLYTTDSNATVLATANFDHNDYQLADTSGRYWHWEVGRLAWDDWQGVGHDVNGTLVPL
jgi:hypothetical protein